MLRTHALYGACHEMLHAAHFDFNIQERAASVTVQNIFQTRGTFFSGSATCLKLFERVLAYYQSVQPGIMADDGVFVAGVANVKFKTVRAMFQGQIKCSEGIFRRVPAGASMSEQ